LRIRIRIVERFKRIGKDSGGKQIQHKTNAKTFSIEVVVTPLCCCIRNPNANNAKRDKNTDTGAMPECLTYSELNLVDTLK